MNKLALVRALRQEDQPYTMDLDLISMTIEDLVFQHLQVNERLQLRWSISAIRDFRH